MRRKIFFCIFRNPAEERPRRGFYLGPQAQPCAEGARCVCRVSFQRPKAPSFFMAATREAASKYTQEKELKLKKSVVVKAGVPFPLGTIGLRKRLPKPLYADKTTIKRPIISTKVCKPFTKSKYLQINILHLI